MMVSDLIRRPRTVWVAPVALGAVRLVLRALRQTRQAAGSSSSPSRSIPRSRYRVLTIRGGSTNGDSPPGTVLGPGATSGYEWDGDMNWTWSIRSRDGAMNGLEFSLCTTAGGFSQVLVHAAPAHAKVEIVAADDRLIARGDLDRCGEYSPTTLVELDGSSLRRSEVWPTEKLCGNMPRITVGGGGRSNSPTTPADPTTGRPPPVASSSTTAARTVIQRW